MDTSKPRDSWLRSLKSSKSKLLARSRVTRSALSANGSRGSLDVAQAERTDAVVETVLPIADDGTVVPGPTAYPWIPLEIQQYIIGFLVPGSRGALTAALVCRSWYSAAMAVLYYSITFPPRSKAPSVNALSLRAFEHRCVRAQLANTNTVVFQSGSFSSAFPLAFARIMTSLAALQMHDLTEPLHPIFFKVMSHFVSVTELDLRGAALYNLQTLQRLICALRYLEVLCVSGLYI